VAVTIKDIAKRANVSHTTVSRALNDSCYIKSQTKKQILEIAKEMNYVPNYNAKSLVTKKSNTIGLFFTSISSGTSSSFFTEVIDAVVNELDENYNLAIRGLDTYDNFSSIVTEKFDGIILMSQEVSDDDFITYVKGVGIPIVVLNRNIQDKDIINIFFSDREGVKKGVSYLIENNHHKIACISGISGFKSTDERQAGYMEALREYGIQVLDEYIVTGAYTMKSGYRAMQQLLSLATRPTAVFCSNDDMAIGAIKAIHEYGLKVPDDISVVGFDSIPFAEYTIPSLTSIKRKIKDISHLAAEKLLTLMNSDETQGELIMLETSLIKRESVKKLDK
jgi:LacI family transcriptional regulator